MNDFYEGNKIFHFLKDCFWTFILSWNDSRKRILVFFLSQSQTRGKNSEKFINFLLENRCGNSLPLTFNPICTLQCRLYGFSPQQSPPSPRTCPFFIRKTQRASFLGGTFPYTGKLKKKFWNEFECENFSRLFYNKFDCENFSRLFYNEFDYQ